MSNISFSEIKHVAFRILSRRDHAVNELKEKLLQKLDVELAQIDPLITEFKQLNYLNDERFALLYCSYRSKKGFGPKRIEQELIQKLASGLDAQKFIALALNGPESPDWSALATKTYLKKFKKPPKDFQEQQKHKQFLYYRGFNSDEIDEALSTAFKPNT